jgi:TonB family protein
MSRRSTNTALATAALLAALAAASPAWAQQSPPAQPPPSGSGKDKPSTTTGSVPSGAGGAVIVAPKTDGEEAPTPGKATLPRPLNYAPPEYPPEAKKAGLEGTVTLQLDIDRNGKVTKAAVVESAGSGFDEAAIAAANKLEFAPARRADGTPFAARILYRYSFNLKSEPAVGAGQPGAAAAPDAIESFAGTVLASQGDAALAGATVTLKGTSGNPTATTSEEGSFVFEDLPPGKYQVTVEVPGYQPLTVEEEIVEGEQMEVKYRLVPVGDGLEVTVRGARPPREVTKRTLQAREINRIPGTNGDALRSIQSLPGVARPPAIAGILIVRGSAPNDTQTFVDGTPVPLIYHFGGLSSVVPTEMLEKIDFYPGNFSAQYGRVMGGIVDAGLRSPKDDGKYYGLAQVDFIDARVLVEGPIPLLNGWTFMAAARRSHIDSWLGPALEAAGAGVTQAPVYYDYQLLVEKKPTPTSRFRAAFFGSDDALELIVNEPAPNEPALAGNIGLNTAFQRIQFRYDNDFSENDSINALLALGQDSINFGLGSFYFLLNLKTITGRLEYTRRMSKGIRLNTGLDMVWGHYDVRVRIPAPSPPGQPANQPFSTRTTREIAVDGSAYLPSAYAELEIAPNARSKIVPGIRADYTNFGGRLDISPRVNGRYDIVHGYPRTTAKAGFGIFHQPPQFQEAVAPIGTPGLYSNRAIQYAVGAEQELNRNLELSVEGFYKQLDSLVRGQVSTTGGTNIEYVNAGIGYVVGAEVLLKYKPDDRFFGWLAYTLSRSVRRNSPDLPEQLVNFDQPHILTVLGSYQLGHGWEVGARFRLVSGNLITPTVCNVNQLDCNPSRTNALFHAASGAYTPIPFSAPASERLPLYHSLDMRVDKRWKFKSWQLSAYLDVQNVYNNGNAEGLAYSYNYTERQYVSGLTILPSFGLRADF